MIADRLGGETSRACLFRSFLASMCSIPPSRIWGWAPLDKQGFYDLLSRVGQRIYGHSKIERQRFYEPSWGKEILISMVCLREELKPGTILKKIKYVSPNIMIMYSGS
jgi:hypothetical protein